MHVHWPKPLHGWREFLGEVGIIVLGVLIALGAEQVIEMVHWQTQVRAERRALEGEVRYNLGAALYRIAEQHCIDGRLNEIAIVFQRHAADQPLQLRAPVLRPVLWVGTTGTWDIAASGQALTHMPLDEKLRFSDAFGTFRAFTSLRGEEDEVWRTFSLLDQVGVLNDSDWSRLHAAYADAKSISDRMRLLAPYLLDHEAVDQRSSLPELRPDAVAAERAFCTPIIN
jgi:hypothetical protein